MMFICDKHPFIYEKDQSLKHFVFQCSMAYHICEATFL